MRTEELKSKIFRDAEEINRLGARVKETFRAPRTEANVEAWRKACAEFYCRYEELAFPGGYTGAHERLLAGDAQTIEAALCFLEVRPYFFRSGYMFAKLIKKIKHAPLSKKQTDRLKRIVEDYERWKREKAARRIASRQL